MDDHITSRFVRAWICCDFTFTVFRTYYVDMSEARLQKEVATSVSELIEEGADVKRLRISHTNSLIHFQGSLL